MSVCPGAHRASLVQQAEIFWMALRLFASCLLFTRGWVQELWLKKYFSGAESLCQTRQKLFCWLEQLIFERLCQDLQGSCGSNLSPGAIWLYSPSTRLVWQVLSVSNCAFNIHLGFNSSHTQIFSTHSKSFKRAVRHQRCYSKDRLLIFEWVRQTLC